MTGPEVTAAMKTEDVDAALVERAKVAVREQVEATPGHVSDRLAERIARHALAAVLPEIQAQALLGARAELQAAYRRGPGSRLDGLEKTWRKGMAKAHRIVQDYQESLTTTTEEGH